MLTIAAKILKILNSETEPRQISLAICFAMIIGLTPLWNLHNFFILLLVLILRVNLTTFIVAWAGFAGISYLLDPLFHLTGLAILTLDSLESFWVTLYNSTLGRLSNFNNSVFMGSLVISLVCFVPLYFVMNLLIQKYREHILAWVMKSRLMQALKASKFYSVYQSVSDWGGFS